MDVYRIPSLCFGRFAKRIRTLFEGSVGQVNDGESQESAQWVERKLSCSVTGFCAPSPDYVSDRGLLFAYRIMA